MSMQRSVLGLVLSMGVLIALPASARPAGPSRDFLIGSWHLKCEAPPPAPGAPGFSFEEMVSYLPGGVQVESNTLINATSFDPTNPVLKSGSEGHGAWWWAGHGQWGSSFMKFLFDDAGHHIGYLQPTATISRVDATHLHLSGGVTMTLLTADQCGALGIPAAPCTVPLGDVPCDGTRIGEGFTPGE